MALHRYKCKETKKHSKTYRLTRKHTTKRTESHIWPLSKTMSAPYNRPEIYFTLKIWKQLQLSNLFLQVQDKEERKLQLSNPTWISFTTSKRTIRSSDIVKETLREDGATVSQALKMPTPKTCLFSTLTNKEANRKCLMRDPRNICQGEIVSIIFRVFYIYVFYYLQNSEFSLELALSSQLAMISLRDISVCFQASQNKLLTSVRTGKPRAKINRSP